MDLNPNGINLFLWLRSDCLVSTTQITLESVIHIRFRFWLLVCFFKKKISGSKSNADIFFFDAIWDRRGMRFYPRSVELLTSLWVEARQDCAQTGSEKKNIRGGENLSTWWNFWMLLHWTLSLWQLPSPTPHQTLLCTEAAAAASQRAITVGCIPLLSTLLLHILPNETQKNKKNNHTQNL